jgi:type I restriction enzyme R subunit
MSNPYSEDKLIEQTTIDIFAKSLGWEVLNVEHGETFGDHGTLGRHSLRDVILRRDFFRALRTLNPNLPDQAYKKAYEVLTAESATKSYIRINLEKYQLLRNGIPVTYKNEKGEIVRNKKLRVFNFGDYTDNIFLAVQQFWVEGKSWRKRRPDVVGFVNGIPLLLIELKAHHVKIRAAYEDNLSDYKDTIPRLFHFNAFIILSNGFQNRIGTLTSNFEHFHEWKRINEEEEGVVSLETIITGVCEKSRFMDLFENFILYDTGDGEPVKIVSRNHQFLGVNRAIGHFTALQGMRKELVYDAEETKKMGVFWHTQGSGKSYSMVFMGEKIHRKVPGSYTFVIVTDRLELDKQIYGTFQGTGVVDDPTARATSGDDLKALLKTGKRYIFTIIHKFNFKEVITQRDDIIVVSDEAHRTQGGTLALNMRMAMPNACFIGFTGTPLFKHDEITKRIFGDYVSVYNFRRSVEDGATVPLYYENRGEKLKLDNPSINEEMRRVIDETDLDPDQEDKLKRLFAREYPVLTAEKRLRAIAGDIVEHFNTRGYKGKGMLVSLDKVTAVKMYNFITEAWQEWIIKKEAKLESASGNKEMQELKASISWAKETEIAVVVSSEQNEIKKFKAWGLDIEPHRAKMNDPTRDLEADFKEAGHPFRFVIVCAMWITGFDVKSLSTIYLDKPLKAHTLMQTIARANRVHEDKNNGLIVDYIETYKNLLEALAIYAEGGSGENSGGGAGGPEEPPVKPLEELIEELRETIDVTESYLKDEIGFELNTIIEQEGAYRIKAVQDAVNAVSKTDDTRNKFSVLAREVFKKFKALMPDKAVDSFRDRRDAINAIYAAIQDNILTADVTHVMKKLQSVVDDSIESINMAAEPTGDFDKAINLSSLNFEWIRKNFLKSKHKNTVVQSLKETVARKLGKMVDQNPMRVNFYEKYLRIIEEYNIGKDRVTIEEVFKKLMDLVEELSDEEQRAQREKLTEPQLSIFDLLCKGKKLSDKQKAKVKEIAGALLEILEEEKLKVDHWMDKEQTSADVRSTIYDFLWHSDLPYPAYEETDIDRKTIQIFDYLRTNYGMVG